MRFFQSPMTVDVMQALRRHMYLLQVDFDFRQTTRTASGGGCRTTLPPSDGCSGRPTHPAPKSGRGGCRQGHPDVAAGKYQLQRRWARRPDPRGRPRQGQRAPSYSKSSLRACSRALISTFGGVDARASVRMYLRRYLQSVEAGSGADALPYFHFVSILFFGRGKSHPRVAEKKRPLSA